MSQLTIKFYPARIDDAALHNLCSLALSMTDRAPRFLGWLVDFIHAETRRRIDAEISDNLRECDLPTIDLATFSGQDVGEAVVAITILSLTVTDPEAGEFLDRLAMFFGRLAASRLEAYDRLQASTRGLLDTLDMRRRLGTPIILSPHPVS